MRSIFSAEISAIIPAAGQGVRMGGRSNKLFLQLAGAPVLLYSLKTFAACAYIKEIIVAAVPGEIEEIEKLIEEHKFTKAIKVLPGGRERQESVLFALKGLCPESRRVVVHDGARPLLTLDQLNSFLEQSRDFAAAVTALPLKDTVKVIDGQNWVVKTPPRERLRAIQTPQVFDRLLLEKLHKEASAGGFCFTDDASLMEWQRQPVKVLDGFFENIKITTPDDFLLAEAIIRMRSKELLL